MRRILVTAIGGDVANGILKVLQEMGDELYGCDIYDYPVGMDKVVDFWKSVPAVSQEYIPGLLKKCREIGITHLMPVNEEEIKFISLHRALFEREGIKVMIHPFHILEVFLDKYQTYLYLSHQAGISVPKTFEYKDFKADGKKYIAKLKQSSGSKFIKIITEKKDMGTIGIDEGSYIIQEYIDSAEEYTVGVFSDGIRTETIIFKRKLLHGYTAFVELVSDTSIEEQAIAIAKNIGLKGYINIQLRKRNGKNYIFEINPRISGTVVFRHMLGFDDVRWWLEMLDGNNFCEYRHIYKKAIGMRELSEKFVVLDK